MFKRLLVPLDGSGLAEAVLPAALYFATKFGATILLFHAIEQDARQMVHGEHHLSEPAEAEAYLSDVAARLTRPTVAVTKHVHAVEQADVTRSIIEHAAEHQVDLVVLCAHGHGGWRDMIVGNIAQQVIARGTIPVLFIRPEKTGGTDAYSCRKVLLPLDGTPRHEPALPFASAIAQTCNAAIRLVTVVPTVGTLSGPDAGAGTLLPTTMKEILEFAQRGAVEYLQREMRQLAAAQVQVTAEVARGEPAASILDAEKRAHADLVVMATHGRTAADAFWSGSVTPKVLARSRAPVLLVRAVGEEV